MKQELNSELAEIQISYVRDIKFQHIVTSSDEVSKLMKSQFYQNTIEYQEEFKVLYLDRANRVLGVVNHSSGGIHGTVVDLKQIIGVACKANSTGIVLIHNHPSGNLKPSNEDVCLTRKVKNACDLLDIQLLDHLILTKESYFSFADQGMI